MAVSAWSNLLGINRCVVCKQRLAPGNATIACAYANGQPALACDLHRNDKVGWITAWTDFYRQQQGQVPPTPDGNARLYIETRALAAYTDIKMDVCWHLFTRSMAGRCVIVTDRPIEFLSVLRKHWKKINRLLHMERACTLDTQKRLALQEAIGRLQILSFSATIKSMQAEVLIVSPSDITALTGNYPTLYICTVLSEQQKATLLKALQRGAVCVDYAGVLGQLDSVAA